MKASTIYSLKVWAFTIILPPIIFLIIFGSNDILEILEEFIPFILWGGFSSLPSLFLFKAAADYIFEKVEDSAHLKIQMNIVGILVCLLPIVTIFLIRDGIGLLYVFGLAYSMALTVAVWGFGLKRKVNNQDLHPNILDDDF